LIRGRLIEADDREGKAKKAESKEAHERQAREGKKQAIVQTS